MKKRKLSRVTVLRRIRSWIKLNGVRHQEILGGTLFMIRGRDSSFVKLISTDDLISLLSTLLYDNTLNYIKTRLKNIEKD